MRKTEAQWVAQYRKTVEWETTKGKWVRWLLGIFFFCGVLFFLYQGWTILQLLDKQMQAQRPFLFEKDLFWDGVAAAFAILFIPVIICFHFNLLFNLYFGRNIRRERLLLKYHDLLVAHEIPLDGEIEK